MRTVSRSPLFISEYRLDERAGTLPFLLKSLIILRKIHVARADEELIGDINEYLDQYYPDEECSKLYDASKALLEISKELEEDETDRDENDEFSDGSYNEEQAQLMTDLERELQIEEDEEIDEDTIP